MEQYPYSPSSYQGWTLPQRSKTYDGKQRYDEKKQYNNFKNFQNPINSNSTKESRQLFIKNLPPIPQENLNSIFSKYGDIAFLTQPRNKPDTAFLTFYDIRSAIKCKGDLSTNGLNGRQLFINYSLRQPSYSGHNPEETCARILLTKGYNNNIPDPSEENIKMSLASFGEISKVEFLSAGIAVTFFDFRAAKKVINASPVQIGNSFFGVELSLEVQDTEDDNSEYHGNSSHDFYHGPRRGNDNYSSGQNDSHRRFEHHGFNHDDRYRPHDRFSNNKQYTPPFTKRGRYEHGSQYPPGGSYNRRESYNPSMNNGAPPQNYPYPMQFTNYGMPGYAYGSPMQSPNQSPAGPGGFPFSTQPNYGIPPPNIPQNEAPPPEKSQE